MKKITSFLLVFVLLLSVLLMSVSCSGNHPIDKFRKRMEKENNYQISFTIYNVPIYDRITTIIKVDKNIQYIKVLETEGYVETTENETYVYKKSDSEKWVKQKYEENTSNIDNEEIESIFYSKYFEEVEGEKNKYKQKASVTFEHFEDVVITLEEDGCAIELTYFIEGETYESYKAKITVSKFGEIKLTLPATD